MSLLALKRSSSSKFRTLPAASRIDHRHTVHVASYDPTGKAPMLALQVRLFGHFRLSSGDPASEQTLTSKAKELFCYLLLRRNRPHSREVLVSLLWQDATTAQSRKYLRQVLWQLHSFLLRLANPQVLRINDDRVELCTRSDLWARRG